MAKLAAKKKPTKPDAPKKPTSRSKTGNAECSQAASNWQLSLRGKATLNPGTYQTLAKCRALSKSGQMADAQGRTGKLSDQGAAALKGRLQKRFDSGLITQKSRNERLNMLLKQRSERGKVETGKTDRSSYKSSGVSPAIGAPKFSKDGDPAIVNLPLDKRGGGSIDSQLDRYKKEQSKAKKAEMKDWQKTYAEERADILVMNDKYGPELAKRMAKKLGKPIGEVRSAIRDIIHRNPAQARKMFEQEAKAASTPPPASVPKAAPTPAPAPARYSLGGKLAPGRGNVETAKTAVTEGEKQPLKYTPKTKIDTPAQGELYSAKKALDDTNRRIKLEIRQNPRWNDGSMGRPSDLVLKELQLSSQANEARARIRNAESAIEKRANELGLTTKKPPKPAPPQPTPPPASVPKAASLSDKQKSPWEISRKEYESSVMPKPSVQGQDAELFRKAQQGMDKFNSVAQEKRASIYPTLNDLGITNRDRTKLVKLGLIDKTSNTLTIQGRIESSVMSGENPWLGGPIKTHKQLVQEAIREGKQVPANVLADYPDLKPPASVPKAAPTPAPARYSLGGKLAPGRGTEGPSYKLNVGNSIDRSGKLVPGYAARITGTDPKYKLKREFLPMKDAKDGGLTVSERGLYESRGPSTSIFGTDRANKPTEREYILIGRKKVRNLMDFQAERAVRLMERFRKS